MRPSRRRGRRALRVTRLEPMEPRLLMSADPTGSLTLDDFVECSIDSQLRNLARSTRSISPARRRFGPTTDSPAPGKRSP